MTGTCDYWGSAWALIWLRADSESPLCIIFCFLRPPRLRVSGPLVLV